MKHRVIKLRGVQRVCWHPTCVREHPPGKRFCAGHASLETVPSGSLKGRGDVRPAGPESTKGQAP